MSDLWGTLLTKIGIESESVLGLRSQIESIQGGETKVNWVAHSRGGTEFVQAAQGSGVKDLSNNSVVFHAGANTVPATTSMINAKKIGDVIDKDNRYRDAPNDLVPQIVGLRDIGGIIVIDFIDMVLPANRELLLRRLVECLGRDRTRHQVAEVTSLGLVPAFPAVVGALAPGGAAEGRLQVGDRILSLDGEPVHTYDQVAPMLQRLAALQQGLQIVFGQRLQHVHWDQATSMAWRMNALSTSPLRRMISPKVV